MLGWMNDCLEKLVVERFGIDAWHEIKTIAKCDVADGGFLRFEEYPDQGVYDLIHAGSKVSGLGVDVLLEEFGRYFVPYISNSGHENLLWCQGNTLKDWATNINAIHSHLQTTFPNKMTMPEFWVEEAGEDRSLHLHFVSARGPILAPVGKGIVMAVAEKEFELDIIMEQLQTQGQDGAKATTWRITTRDPMDMFKLTQKKNKWIENISPPRVLTCPMSGITLSMANDDEMSESSANGILDSPPRCPNSKNNSTPPSKKSKKQSRKTSVSTVVSQMTRSTEESEVSDDEFDDDDSFQAPVKMTADQAKSVYSKSTRTSKTSSTGSSVGITSNTATAGLSIAMTRKLFPYHITLSKHFVILDVGEDLPKILDVPNTELVGRLIEDVFLISKPDSAKWTKGWLRRLEGQTITLDSLVAQGSTMRFAGSVVTMIDSIDAKWMLILAPDASNLTELRGIGLTLSDLPAHGCYRDAVFLREHLSSQMQDALKMEKLSKSLQREKGLLESLLPQHAAEGLRMGRTVKPRLHNNVTIFFSDVVGFTSIADKLYPWQVINMLNQLYCIMDFLAIKFHLFKIETIGDAYVCCSGLPVTDENHAKNVANFALAVRHCCRHVKSPVDGEPIQLRIGIHSGACASGVVGVTNPRYCVFGDTMNTTARHETTGMANMIHCSSVTRTELSRNAPNLFSLKRRGKVEMKGKGTLTTYWLDASESNETFTGEGLAQLDELVLIELGQMASFGADDTLKQDQTKLPASPVKSDCSLDMEAHDNRFLGDMLACLSPLLPTKKNNPFGLPPGMLLSPTPSLMMFI